MVHSTFAVVVM